MKADEILVRPDPLRSAAVLFETKAEVASEACRRIATRGYGVALNRDDPSFNVAHFGSRIAATLAVLRRAAAELEADAELMQRSVEETVLADASSAGVGRSFVQWTDLADARDRSLIDLDVPSNPLWYLERIGSWGAAIGNHLGEHFYASVGGCVGVCASATFQDGVVTATYGAGLAYSLGADAGYKSSVIDEDERNESYEDHRYFLGAAVIGGEYTREQNSDEHDNGKVDHGVAIGIGPSMPVQGGWAHQWNHRWDLRREKPKEEDS